MRCSPSVGPVHENRLRGGIGVFAAVARRFLGSHRRRAGTASMPASSPRERTEEPTAAREPPPDPRPIAMRDEIERTGWEWWSARLRAVAK